MSSANASALVAPDPFRLPSHVRPTRYDVLLRPTLDDASFSGEVSIKLDVSEPTTSIVLNAVELWIDEVRVEGINATWSLDESTERMTVELDEAVAESTTLFVRFRGTLNDKLRGFYRSTYIDAFRHCARDRYIPDAGDRLSPSVPLLGRASVQGGVRDHA